ncbi:MAG: ABC transporter ATP-binding protein [Burkholderiales bacterium]|nr:ABC transporter ATP-binding protein [Burkholderiales bacterium]
MNATENALHAHGSGAATGIAVRLEGVTKSYETREGDEIPALDRTDLAIEPGEFVAIVGPSGCGKSTTLGLIAGLMAPSSGLIRVDGEVVKKPHPRIGVVFQTDLLLYWRTVTDNILLPIEIKQGNVREFLPRAEALLEQVGLQGFGGKYPSELSGGMRQRVAICRALIQSPGLLLMDEPFGALDALTREQMIVDLQAMWLSVRNTVLFITHSIDEAVFLADRVIVMSPRPGRIDLDLRIDLPRPRRWAVHTDPRFADYMGQVRRIFEAKGVLVEH